MFTQGEPEYREFGDYSPIIEPFRSKPVIVDLNTGKLEIVNNVPKDTNIYWPIYKMIKQFILSTENTIHLFRIRFLTPIFID